MKKYIACLFLFLSCTAPKKIIEDQSNHFPVTEEKVNTLPQKDKFYIFIMAGQSNMAGRGFVQPSDTVSSPNVLVLNKNNVWVHAKEPLHYYEPGRTGLDCGLSFGKKLSSLYGKDITIGLVPCAIGGSSVEQWLGDSLYRNVKLFSNFSNKATAATAQGTIKGILWHQGESNSSVKGYINYQQKLESLFTNMRAVIKQNDLPIYAGQLATFLNKKENPHSPDVNNDLEKIAITDHHFYIIHTGDLTPKSDTLHFDSRSQRMMGERFAREAYRH
ncbi:MAG: sialate O-acetylesterase [Chitinophagaceae bacterium]